MTTRKPKTRKPARRKRAISSSATHRKNPTFPQRVADLEAVVRWNGDCIDEINKRINSLETRGHFRDASHDDPVSNANEVIGGLYPQVTPIFQWVRNPMAETEPPRPWWRRFLDYMRSP